MGPPRENSREGSLPSRVLTRVGSTTEEGAGALAMNRLYAVGLAFACVLGCSSPECRVISSTDSADDCTYIYSDVATPEGVLKNPYPLPIKQSHLLASIDCYERGEDDLMQRRYRYNEGGQLLSESRLEGDQVLYTVSFDYDGEGRLTGSDLAWDPSSQEDYTQSSTFRHDSEGRVIEEEQTDSNPATHRITYTYDSEGRLQQTETDRDADGSIDVRSTYTYDDEGHLLRRDGDDGADGNVDETETFTTQCE